MAVGASRYVLQTCMFPQTLNPVGLFFNSFAERFTLFFTPVIYPGIPASVWNGTGLLRSGKAAHFQGSGIIPRSSTHRLA
jgi:hypothetical protein